MTARSARLVARRVAKHAAANLVGSARVRRGLARLERRAPGERVLFVAYHHVVPDVERMRERVIPGLVTSTETFERQLDALGASFRLATMTEALDVLSRRARAERDLCVITFDDGYRTFVRHALPVLERRGVPATLYVPTTFIGSSTPLLHDRLYAVLRLAETGDPVAAVDHLLEHESRAACLSLATALEEQLGVDPADALVDSAPMSWDELRAASAAGVEIGSHTLDHVCLHTEPRSEVARQVRESRATLERELGAQVLDFAYPNGRHTAEAEDEVRAAGYRSALTTEARLNRIGASPFALRRKSVWEDTSRGVRGFSPAVAACNFDDVFAQLRLSSSRAR